MKLGSAPARYVLVGIGIALLAAAGLMTLLPAGQASAQPEPTIELLPASGPCDGVVDMRGTGFEPPAEPFEFLRLYLLRPGTEDVAMRASQGAVVQPDGTFVARMGPGVVRCDVAALDSEADEPSGHLVIAATASTEPVSPGERIPGIIAVARYAYTTTATPPEPIISLTPASGRCDAPTRVTGRGFEPRGSPGSDLLLYLLEPGTADVNMGILNPAWADRDGAFAQWVGMRQHGCEVAALDSEAEVPSRHVVIAVARRVADIPTGEGERIPNIIATAQYEYTTTAPHVPTEHLSISPASGPCDGTVEVTGRGFEPGMEVLLKLGRPASDASLGTLASPAADANGGFSVQFSLTELGCRAAELNSLFGDPTRPRLGIGAYAATRPIPVPPGIPPVLAGVAYTFTTTVPTAGLLAQALPATGSGPGASSGPSGWPLLAGALGGLGVMLVLASVYSSRSRA